MCGIAGIVSLDGHPVFEAELHRMCDAMVHRGPDGEGIFTAPEVGLAMRRLSIIDLQTGDQPIANEDRTVWVVLNGEIYNYRALRAELESRGHVFSTTSDTEVIVHLYEEVGMAAVDRLRGMFTFAIWDARLRRTFIVRDRLGIKPLYYTETGGRLLFASELKSLLALPAVARRLNPNALAHVLAFLTSPSQDSVVEGVHKLEPGHWILAERDTPIRIGQYWDVRFEPDTSHDEAYFAERVSAVLDESVRLHMVSDVPVGAFLSGGLDSSAVVAAMTKHANGPIKTFSVGFDEPDFDERPHARRVAELFGTEHHELVVAPADVGVIETIVRHLDEPFGDASAIPMYMVSKLAAEHVKVVLSGDGGDELFAGYDKYRVEERQRRLGTLPAAARAALRWAGRLMPEGMTGRNFVRHHALTGWERHVDSATFFDRPEQARLLHPDVRRTLSRADPWTDLADHLTAAPGHWLAALQYLDVKSYLPLDILTKVDRMSMAHSIEARVPLLDHELVELAATIPPGMQLNRGRTKHLFKTSLRGTLPDDLIDRPKRGFAVPLDQWFRGSLSGMAHDLLLSQRSRERGIFDAAYVTALLARQQRGRPLDLQVWTLMTIEQWCRSVLDPDPPSATAPPRPASTGRYRTLTPAVAL